MAHWKQTTILNTGARAPVRHWKQTTFPETAGYSTGKRNHEYRKTRRAGLVDRPCAWMRSQNVGMLPKSWEHTWTNTLQCQ
jgi:hypothetical protein